MTRPTADRSPVSLSDYAEGKGTQCKLCGIAPELLSEITAAHTRDPKRFGKALIAKYLRDEHKVFVTDSSVKRHFANHA